MKRPAILLAASITASSLALLSGCLFNNPFEATDNQSQQVTISAETVGKLAVTTMAQSQAFSGSLSAAGTATDPLTNSAMPATGLQKGLAKAGSGSRVMAGDPIIDSSGIADGILRYISTSSDLFGCVSIDTITVQAENLENWISIHGSKTCGNRIESYSVVDADGNGIVAGASETNPKARLLCSVTYTVNDIFGHKAGMIETLALTASAGPDDNFDTNDDNVIYEAAWNRTMEGDTLASAAYTDADNDGLIIDNGSTLPSVVDVAYFEKDPAFNPFVEYSKLDMRIITDGNPANDQVIKLSGEEKLVTGRINSIVVIDTTGDSVISSGEIAEAIFAAVWIPASDSLISSRASIVFDPVDGLANDDDNLYYELHLNETKQFGIVRSISCDFTTDVPVPEGQEPSSGHLAMSVEYSNGKTASIVADFTPGYFTGTYTAPDGTVTTVTWNADGEVVSQN